ncbi:MAG TPA: IS1595 family transposase [Burkholderiales bacterium]|nr:IS1595 family transposase [Burkholderiales bacterium]
MADAILNQPHFKDETKARQWLEAIRWPLGAVCPHCGSINKDHYKLEGEAHRVGLWKCKDCREQFTVTVGTVFERSKVKLNVWLQAMQLIGSSKKGISSKQLERMLGVTYQTAWFMSHRIREAMKHPGGVFGTGSAPIEADATYVGGKESNKHKSKRNSRNVGGVGKQCVFTLVERGGNARSFHIGNVSAKNLKPLIQEQLDTANTRLITDGERILRVLTPMVAKHETVNHQAGEYVRGDVHTNTIEGFFSILKRGIIGTFHHVSPQHLQRYVTEFDFRYNHRETKVQVDGKWVKAGHNDIERTIAIAKGIGGKRLTYRRTNAAA